MPLTQVKSLSQSHFLMKGVATNSRTYQAKGGRSISAFRKLTPNTQHSKHSNIQHFVAHASSRSTVFRLQARDHFYLLSLLILSLSSSILIIILSICFVKI